MGFNITVRTDDVFDVSLWYLSEFAITEQTIECLQAAYRAVQSMWNSKAAFIFRIQQGSQPKVGQVSPGVFICDATHFEFGDVVLVNDEFWKICPDGIKLDDINLVGAMLLHIASIEEGEYAKLKQMERDHCFHCIDVYVNPTLLGCRQESSPAHPIACPTDPSY